MSVKLLRFLTALWIATALGAAPVELRADNLLLMGLGAPVAGTPPAGTTWNPAQTGTTGALSGGNLTFAVSSAATFAVTQSSAAQTTGKCYFEVTVNTGVGGTANAVAVGFGIAGVGLNAFLGNDSDGIGWYDSNQVYFGGTQLFSTAGGFSNGSILAIALDKTGSLAYLSWNGTSWNAGGTASPLTSTGGYSFAGFAGSPVFEYASGINRNSATSSQTANFSGPFNYSSLYTSLQGIGYSTC